MSQLRRDLVALAPGCRIHEIRSRFGPGRYAELFDDLEPHELSDVVRGIHCWPEVVATFAPEDREAWHRYVRRERDQDRKDDLCKQKLGEPTYDVSSVWSFFERGDLVVGGRIPVFFKRDGGPGGAHVKWLAKDEIQDALFREQANRHGVFFSPHRLQEGAESHAATFVVRPAILSVDWDEKHDQTMPTDFIVRAKPHLVVRSGGGMHAHFFLSAEERSALTVQHVNECGRALAAVVGADQNIYRAGSLMRLPWTYHLKNHERPFLLEVVRDE